MNQSMIKFLIVMKEKLPTIKFEWNWIKDKTIHFTTIPYTQNYHLIVVDEEDNMCGFWLLERIERYER